MIPEYLNCDSKYVVSCAFLLSADCPNTCNYSKELGGVWNEHFSESDLVEKIRISGGENEVIN